MLDTLVSRVRILAGMNNTKQRILGAVLGQAIGDAMGSQTEFSKYHEATALGPTWGYNFPAYSDDTQMALAIAEALIATPPIKGNDYAIDCFGTEVARNFVRWTEGEWGRNDRSPGGTCLGGVSAIRRMGAERWKDTGSLNGKGNGGVMRSSLVGCALWQDPKFAFQIGALTSVPTHNHLESLLASGACSYLVAQAINGVPFGQALGTLNQFILDWDDVLLTIPQGSSDAAALFCMQRFNSAYLMARAMTVRQFHSYNGNDGKTVEALAAAIHANAKHSNYGDIVCDLANNTGDSDSTAAIGGAIAGARFGYGFIRRKWRKQIEQSAYLHELADKLYHLYDVPVSDTVVA